MKRFIKIFSRSFVILLTAIVLFAFLWPQVGNYIRQYAYDWGWDNEVAQSNTYTYFTPKHSTEKAANLAAKEVALDVQAEGSVLLKNERETLPLLKSERNITVFGTGSVNIAYGGTGSGEGNGADKVIDLYSALQDAGFSINEKVHRFYLDMYAHGYRRGNGTDMNGAYFGQKGSRNYGYSINEIEREKYTSVRDSYSDYSDAALVIISRSGGEGQDLPTTMSEFYEQNDRHYLTLTVQEEELLQEVKQGKFHKVIVILNTLNTFECGFLQDEGIDAALWIGGPGQHGLDSVAKILIGERAPEGRLPDIYAANLKSAPAMMNYGDNNYYKDKNTLTSASYVAYEENIYVGYRYYETRWWDSVNGTGNAGSFDYEKEVIFPFGFGLSYTQFIWDVAPMSVMNSEISVFVTVTNIGDRAGRDTVEVYLQKPYTTYDKENKIEKSAVELVGYRKTKELAAGESQTVEIKFPENRLSSYDANNKKTYYAQKGSYFLTPAVNAHEAAKNFLQQKNVLTYELVNDRLFDVSGTGYPITNRFETEGYSSLPSDMPLLSRQNWQQTYPTVYGDDGYKPSASGKAYKRISNETEHEIINTDGKAHLGKNDDMTDYVYDRAQQQLREVKIGKPTVNSGRGLLFSDMWNEQGEVLNYDDPRWKELVECMSADELYLLCSSGYGQTPQINSIQKRRTITSDSPMGLHCGTLFPCYPIQAATWDTQIAGRVGEALAQEGLWNDVRAWYAPACNTHRTPFGGRNYEYYSEDSTLAGKYAASVVKAVQANGLFVHLKHFALNDQDTNRGDRGNFRNGDPYNGLCTYVSEQTIREIYLRTFQIAVEEGGAHGVMTSYNRIGNTWAGGHHGLVTEVLRNEWGMQGIALTDYAGTFGYKYMNMNQGLRAGNDQWLYPGNGFPIDDRTSDGAIYYLQKSAKNILFAEANSSRRNNQKTIDHTAIMLPSPVETWHILTVAGYAVILTCYTILTIKLHKKGKIQ